MSSTRLVNFVVFLLEMPHFGQRGATNFYCEILIYQDEPKNLVATSQHLQRQKPPFRGLLYQLPVAN